MSPTDPPRGRRDELLDAAEMLFGEKGFEETAVADIVAAAGVAQGTFYNYFRTKDEIIDALVERYKDLIEPRLAAIRSQQGPDAIDKMALTTQAMGELKASRAEFIDFLHEERNELLHHRIERVMAPLLVAHYTGIIEQGIEEGLFDTEYPHHAAVAMVAVAREVAERAQYDGDPSTNLPALKATLDISERILGTEKGTFMRYLKEMEDAS